MTLYPQLIIDALRTVRYPGESKNIIELGMLQDDMRIDGMKVSFSLLFPKNPDPFSKSVIKAAESAIKLETSQDVEINITALYAPKQPIQDEKALPNVKHIIAVSSGKGGVGKSTVAANLAVALSGQGWKIGLLDADIFGPSIPTMFQLEDFQPYGEMVGDKQMLIPAEKFGMKIMSIGFFIKPGSATVWRGPMASNALKQLITDTLWGELDYLIIDTPPGTSDIHLTLMQTLQLSGAVIVSTPQKVALDDARKGIDMYMNDKINIPILGLVENMAWFTPAELPENKYFIFGKEGCRSLAQELQLPLLAQIPLVAGICESSDKGVPMATHPETLSGMAFHQLADAVTARIQELEQV